MIITLLILFAHQMSKGSAFTISDSDASVGAVNVVGIE